MQQTSLFAQKLRAWRSANGTHGRMTQEELAEKLGVSPDAIGKYERSLSFMRGDIEHRLSDRLGWTKAQIFACREDWAARADHPGKPAYRILDDALVSVHFNGSWREASRASIELAEQTMGALPEDLAANQDVFQPIYETYRDHWTAVMSGGEMVAKWTMVFLLPEDEALFRTGDLVESELSVDRVRQPILPGTYYGYSPALIVRPGHESAAMLLIASFVRFLESLARRDVILHGIGTISCTPGGAQICRDLGMTRIGDHALGPDFGLWDLPGHAIANSIFGRRSALLRRTYSAAFSI